MPIIPPAPSDPRETKVFKALVEKSSSSDGLVERADTLITTATPLLDLIIAGPFQHYTLHNRDHAKKVLHLAGELMSLGKLLELTAVDCFAIVCLAYLHDIGMSVSSVERDRIIDSTDFHEAVQTWPELWAEMESTKERLERNQGTAVEHLSLRLFQLQEAALAYYLRPRHAEAKRYKSIFSLLKQDSGRSDLFSLWGVSLEEAIVEMCSSHNMDAAVLVETSGAYEDRFPRDLAVGRQTLNCQFCAALLRLADVLDFDRERTPRILFDSLGIGFLDHPGSEVSLREWSRHMAVHSISLEPDELVVSADCRHPVIEAAIRDYCRLVEREFRDTSAVLKRNRPEILARYSIDLPISVRPRTRSLGYVFKDMSLRLNQRAVMSLLMGDRLYSNSVVAVRELLQNSIDACRARAAIDPNPSYDPRIVVASEIDDSGGFWLVVEDNGIGMDEQVLNDYFLEVGSSYYSSPEFGRVLMSSVEKQYFYPISRFGIGIVSAFMLADSIVVITKAARSPRGDSKARQIVIQQVGSLAFVTEDVEREVGTSVRLRLKVKDLPGFINLLDEVISFLRERVIRPSLPIELRLGRQVQRLGPGRFFDVHSEGKMFLHSLGIEPIAIRLSRWSKSLTGVVLLLFYLSEDGKLSHLRDGSPPIVGGGEGFPPSQAFQGFEGNRVTVNGFRMILKNTNRIFGKGRQRISAVIDVDVMGDEGIVYDVSRERVIGGKEIRNRIREAVERGVEEMDLRKRLELETQDMLTDVLRREEFAVSDQEKFLELHHVNDPAVLHSVLKVAPEGRWPKYMHKDIAAELGISRNLAARALSTLLARGVILRTDSEDGPRYQKVGFNDLDRAV